ncbi:hypothetical protein A0E62_gp31 [Pyrobaculum filamentous virus 1]|uniref:Uncharacterized protein n=1 Tax=Pyrobaculum filamentous virus 1 TaxID=1805492 RepID=A0A140F3L7_PFV1|nr:hypothetical protein A0E62_gp31 [Pyrobaculum filamentous virus 1]AML61177.1 hypothetical protein [Pyrobaculum filamentous virus 1]
MDNLWIYAGAGFAGFLWGAGTIRGEVAVFDVIWNNDRHNS